MPPQRDPLPRLLAQAFKRARVEVQRRLEVHGVHAGQDYLLDVLVEAEDGLPIGVIADRLGSETPTVVRTVQRMEAAGLVRRERDPADRRRSRVELTERGRAVVPSVRAALDDVERQATAGFSAAEHRALAQLLERARDNLRRIR